jgi:LmbE family N-acetylglucosaminyl deacetylase
MDSEDEKRKQYWRRIEQHEAEEAAKLATASRRFNIDEFIADVEKPIDVKVPTVAYARQKQEVQNAIKRLGLMQNADTPEADITNQEASIEQLIAALKPDFYIVTYKQLTNADILALNEQNVKGYERSLDILFRMLSKADASVTREKIKALGPLNTAQILVAIREKTPLFLP